MRREMYCGAKPSKGTPADQRLKRNWPKPAPKKGGGNRPPKTSKRG